MERFMVIPLKKIFDRAQTGGAAEGEGEADSPLSRKPNEELDPRTLRS